MENHIIIIAEVGECWNGDIKQAEALIETAAEAGCDYVKFQTLDRDTVRDDDPEKEWFLRVALADETIEHFIKYAFKCNIKPLFTPANEKKARFLKERFNLDEVKIASSVFYNHKAVTFIADNFREVFISTGMSTLDEISRILSFFDESKHKLHLLHCISEYPTGPLLEKRGLTALSEENIRLHMMGILKERYPQHSIGYSDHSVGLLAPVCAAAAGAEVIEKHITFDRSGPVKLYQSGKGYLGTDHVFSLEPEELREMIRQIRQVERIMGEWKWERTEGEMILRDFLIGRF